MPAPAIVPNPQVIHTMEIQLLKNLRNLTISFEGSELTAIMGVNGSGKSTILHALTCCFKPIPGYARTDWKFSSFFTPTSEYLWQGSSFILHHSYRIGAVSHNNVSTHYCKTTDRWAPKYERRPTRHTVYIGIDTCTPRIEQEKAISLIHFTTTSPLNNDTARSVKQMAGIVMNRCYDGYHLHTTKTGSVYLGVEYNGRRYSQLSMGAGEQRIFKILGEVFSAPKYSLILIDEIDLLLHTDALKRLILIIKERAQEKKLQVVFTTHSQTVIEMSDLVNIRHIHQTPLLTLCFNETKPDTIFRLTGMQFVLSRFL